MIGEIMRLFVTSLMFVSFVFGQESTRACAVTLRVVDPAGVVQPSYVVKSFTYEGVEFADRFEGLRGTVPCRPGFYEIEVRRSTASTPIASNLSRLDSRITARNPENWLTISTSTIALSADGTQGGTINIARPEGYIWRGRITPTPAEPLWVRITSLANPDYVQGRIESEVDVNGEFRVYSSFFKGPYVLAVMNNKGTILYLAPVTVETFLPEERLEIVLPSSPQTPIVIR